ncbi:MAG: hypothetical protein J5806_09725 [Lentisphaeria bacterium]|nr:hypothetical protein [Lentisphaeria bacterium]
MKRVALFLGIALIGMVAAGCAQALKSDNMGFPSVAPGFLVTDMSVAQMAPQKMLKSYTVIGPVEVEAKTINYLGLVALGDASYATMKRMALEKCQGATDIINIEVDSYHKNVLCLINEVTTKMRATAVKY